MSSCYVENPDSDSDYDFDYNYDQDCMLIDDIHELQAVDPSLI